MKVNPCLLSPSDRLKEWKELRKDLRNLPEDQQLKRTAQFFARYPLNRYFLDWDNPTGWFTPWEIIHNGDVCRSTLALLMEQTLILSNDAVWTPDRLQLVLIKDFDFEEIYLVLVVDRKYVLNYNINDVTPIEQLGRFSQISAFSYCDKKHIEQPSS